MNIEKYSEEFTNKWNALGLDNIDQVCQCAPFSGKECECLSSREKYIDWLRKILTAVAEEARREALEEVKEWAKEQRRVWVKGIEHADLVSEYNDCLDDLIKYLTK